MSTPTNILGLIGQKVGQEIKAINSAIATVNVNDISGLLTITPDITGANLGKGLTTTGTINGGAITGTSLSAGTGTISGGAISGTSASLTGAVSADSASITNALSSGSASLGSLAVTGADGADITHGLDVGADLTVVGKVTAGELEVTGDTKIINTTKVEVSDNIFELNKSEDGSTTAQLSGIEINRGETTVTTSGTTRIAGTLDIQSDTLSESFPNGGVVYETNNQGNKSRTVFKWDGTTTADYAEEVQSVSAGLVNNIPFGHPYNPQPVYVADVVPGHPYQGWQIIFSSIGSQMPFNDDSWLLMASDYGVNTVIADGVGVDLENNLTEEHIRFIASGEHDSPSLFAASFDDVSAFALPFELNNIAVSNAGNTHGISSDSEFPAYDGGNPRAINTNLTYNLRTRDGFDLFYDKLVEISPELEAVFEQDQQGVLGDARDHVYGLLDTKEQYDSNVIESGHRTDVASTFVTDRSGFIAILGKGHFGDPNPSDPTHEPYVVLARSRNQGTVGGNAYSQTSSVGVTPAYLGGAYPPIDIGGTGTYTEPTGGKLIGIEYVILGVAQSTGSNTAGRYRMRPFLELYSYSTTATDETPLDSSMPIHLARKRGLFGEYQWIAMDQNLTHNATIVLGTASTGSTTSTTTSDKAKFLWDNATDQQKFKFMVGDAMADLSADSLSVPDGDGIVIGTVPVGTMADFDTALTTAKS